jgi:DNA-binding IclR family transcriptional regulator
MTDTERGGPIKTANRVFHILESVQELDGTGVSELAKYVELPKSTVHNYLKTLYEIGYLSKEDGEYKLSFKFIKFGRHARYDEDWYGYVEEKVAEIASETGERVQFIAEQNGICYYLFISQGDSSVNITGAKVGNGQSNVFHASSAGKAILAHSTAENVQAILSSQGLLAHTENTITDIDVLREELAAIRDQGYALNDEELIEGLRAVAVPILSPTHEPIGAISVSGPSKRMENDRFEQELSQLLLGIANEIELNITFEVE